MSGHLDLGNDVYMTLSCICNYLAYVFLCIESSICIRILGICERISEAFPLVVGLAHPPCHMVRKVGICIDLEAPAGSISQMQMHDIHPQKRQSVNLLLDELLSLEAAGLVEHDASVLETRIVEYRAILDVTVDQAHHLQALPCPESPFLGHGIYLHTLLADYKFICLFLRESRQTGNFGSKFRIT